MTAQRLKIARREERSRDALIAEAGLMVYVFAVYTTVLALLIGYAIHLRGRRRTLLRALERERD